MVTLEKPEVRRTVEVEHLMTEYLKGGNGNG